MKKLFIALSVIAFASCNSNNTNTPAASNAADTTKTTASTPSGKAPASAVATGNKMKDATGTFIGSYACKDCKEIKVMVSLMQNGDGVYNEHHLGDKDFKPGIEKAKWTFSADSSQIILTGENKKERKFKLNGTILTQLNSDNSSFDCGNANCGLQKVVPTSVSQPKVSPTNTEKKINAAKKEADKAAEPAKGSIQAAKKVVKPESGK
jgi:hypothetical protein